MRARKKTHRIHCIGWYEGAHQCIHHIERNQTRWARGDIHARNIARRIHDNLCAQHGRMASFHLTTLLFPICSKKPLLALTTGGMRRKQRA